MAVKPISVGRRKAFAALALVGLAVASTAARADSIFDIFLPEANPYIVQNDIARLGFIQRSALARRGDVYLCDVEDRYGAPQRLIIDARTGRIVERYAMRSYAGNEPRRSEPRPRLEPRDWGLTMRPEVDVPVPVARQNPVEAAPAEAAPDNRRVPRQGVVAYGEGHAATPTPDTRPVEKPRLKIAHPKHLPAPAASDLPETATAAPTASEPAVQPPAPSPAQATPAAQPPVAAKPAALGIVAGAGPADVPAKPSPAPQAAPAQPAKTKAINDIPVAPLD